MESGENLQASFPRGWQTNHTCSEHDDQFQVGQHRKWTPTAKPTKVKRLSGPDVMDTVQSLDCEASEGVPKPGVHSSFAAASSASGIGVRGACKEWTQSRHSPLKALEFRIRVPDKIFLRVSNLLTPVQINGTLHTNV